MKKLFALMMILALLLCPLALAESADYLGTWYLNGINFGEATLSPATMGMDMIMEINEDGTARLTSSVDEEAEKVGNWALEGDTLTVTFDEGEDMPLSLQEDGSLRGEQGGLGMIFGRELVEVEAYAPAEPVAAESEADFAGKWSAAWMKMEDNYMEASVFGMDLTADIEGTTMTLNGMYIFENQAFEASFADGALSYKGGDEDMYAAITAQLLEDGAMRVTFETEGADDLVMILERAE